MAAPVEPVELSAAQHVERIDRAARELAGYLRDATDAGVSHALILPRLVLVFREVFGEMPAGVAGLMGQLGTDSDGQQ